MIAAVMERIDETGDRDAASAKPVPTRRWLEVLSHLDRRYGGLTSVVPTLTAKLRQQGFSAALAAFCAPDERVDEQAGERWDVSGPSSQASTTWPASRRAWFRDGNLRRDFNALVDGYDGLHIHGLWETSAAVASRAAHRRGKPYIVSAHGMLEPWALAQKAAKKRIYSAFFQRPAMQAAACLHALTLAEAEDYRRFGCTRPIAVIPNAVEAPARVSATPIEQRFPAIGGRRVLLFLGRLHVKKGIELLLAALSEVAKAFPDAVVMLAGPGDADYVRELQDRVAQRGLADRLIFTGMLDQTLKWSALVRAHAFVLPSYSEGLSVAALEALSVGTPVILSEGCHLNEVAECGAGWSIPTTVPALTRALRESLEASAEDRACMARRARQLAATRFSWKTVCGQMAELYDTVLTGATPQTFLRIEGKR